VDHFKGLQRFRFRMSHEGDALLRRMNGPKN